MSCTVFANDRRAASKIVLRIVETPSCTRKNIKIRSHAGYNNALRNGGDTSYTRENLNNRSYADSNTEGVPTNQQNTAKLCICDPIAIRTIKTL